MKWFSKQPTYSMNAFLWAVEGNWLRAHANILNHDTNIIEPDAGYFSKLEDEMEKSMQYTVQDGMAIINVHGPITKVADFWSHIFGGVSSRAVSKQLAAALNDDEVTSIMLNFDSPGGTTDGTEELANNIRKTNAQKPVFAYADGLCCSAAYWCASQCSAIGAMGTALVGSIGTLLVLRDTSKAYSEMGIKVHVIATGDYKGAGTPGSPITKKQLDKFQNMVNGINDVFVTAVAEGRGVNEEVAKNWATGEIWTGTQAADMGLIDEVCSFDEFCASCAELIKNQNSDTDEPAKAGSNTHGGTFDMSNALLDRVKTVVGKNQPNVTSTQKVGGPGGETGSGNEILAQIIEKLRNAGITSVEELDNMIANAQMGATYIADIRSEAKNLVVQRYGLQGQNCFEFIEAADLAALKTACSTWKQELEEKFNFAGGFAQTRVSAPNPLQEFAANAKNKASDNAEADSAMTTQASNAELMAMTTLGESALRNNKNGNGGKN